MANSDVSAYLEERWMKLTCGVHESVCNKWWDFIKSKYSEPERKYHTLNHLKNMFDYLDSYQNDVQDKVAISYSIFFHDLVYEVRSQDNEEDSVKLFKEFAEESDLIQDRSLFSRVEELIMATKNHCTDEHKTEGIYGKEDLHYFLDFDVSILGTSPDEYKKYASQIQEEYNYLPASKYNFLRTKVLQLFLQIPNIYATKAFRDSLEQQARTNIQNEIDWLKKAATDA